jgi:hypothetical protein
MQFIIIQKNYRDSIHIPNPEIILALAIDKRIKDWQFIVQMTGKYVFDFRIPSQPTMPWSIKPSRCAQLCTKNSRI